MKIKKKRLKELLALCDAGQAMKAMEQVTATEMRSLIKEVLKRRKARKKLKAVLAQCEGLREEMDEGRGT